jgi:GNAT superfamily N-acetyltransferase
MEWIVRPASLDDKEQCAALIALSFSSLLRDHYTGACLERCLPLISSPNEYLLTCGTWYVAQHPETKQILGCGGWTPEEPKTERQLNKIILHTSSSMPIPHLRHFASHPAYARQGIAAAIWKRCHDDIKKYFAELGSFPTLEVYSTITAQSFYSSLGFETIEHLTVPLPNGADFPAILMRREPSSID